MFDFGASTAEPDREYIDEATERLLAELEGDTTNGDTQNGENKPFYAFAPSEDADLSDCPFGGD